MLILIPEIYDHIRKTIPCWLHKDIKLSFDQIYEKAMNERPYIYNLPRDDCRDFVREILYDRVIALDNKAQNHEAANGETYIYPSEQWLEGRIDEIKHTIQKSAQDYIRYGTPFFYLEYMYDEIEAKYGASFTENILIEGDLRAWVDKILKEMRCEKGFPKFRRSEKHDGVWYEPYNPSLVERVFIRPIIKFKSFVRSI